MADHQHVGSHKSVSYHHGFAIDDLKLDITEYPAEKWAEAEYDLTVSWKHETDLEGFESAVDQSPFIYQAVNKTSDLPVSENNHHSESYLHIPSHEVNWVDGGANNNHLEIENTDSETPIDAILYYIGHTTKKDPNKILDQAETIEEIIKDFKEQSPENH